MARNAIEESKPTLEVETRGTDSVECGIADLEDISREI